MKKRLFAIWIAVWLPLITAPAFAAETGGLQNDVKVPVGSSQVLTADSKDKETREKGKPENLTGAAAAHRKELEQLQRMEREADEAGKRERAEITRQEIKLVELNRQIDDMKGKFWLKSKLPDMVKQKEQQVKHLDNLRTGHKAAEAKRRREIAQFRDEVKKNLIRQVSTDLTEYQKAVSSKHEGDMKAAAWAAMTVNYPEAEGVKTDDIDGFLKVLGLTRFGGEIVTIEYMMGEIARVTYIDPRTGLMWPKKDNGSDITWLDTKNYCRNYRLGGFNDWRLPTQSELAGLYDARKSYQAAQRNYNVHITNMVQLTTCCLWASDSQGSEGAVFDFSYGTRFWLTKTYSYGYRVLPVRKVNEAVIQPSPAVPRR